MEHNPTLAEITYDLWEIVRAQISDDDSLDERKFRKWIHDQRALQLRNELNKNRTIDDAIIQDLGCVALERVDAGSCCDNPVGLTVVRTVLELPVTIERHNEPTITRVGPLNRMSRPFSIVPYSRVPFITSGKFTKLVLCATLLNKHVYIIGDSSNPVFKGIEFANIRGVFENPEDVERFTTCDGVSCFNSNSPYPINRWMLPYLKNAILQADLKMLVTTPSDTTNDSSPELKEVSGGK